MSLAQLRTFAGVNRKAFAERQSYCMQETLPPGDITAKYLSSRHRWNGPARHEREGLVGRLKPPAPHLIAHCPSRHSLLNVRNLTVLERNLHVFVDVDLLCS